MLSDEIFGPYLAGKSAGGWCGVGILHVVYLTHYRGAKEKRAVDLCEWRGISPALFIRI